MVYQIPPTQFEGQGAAAATGFTQKTFAIRQPVSA